MREIHKGGSCVQCAKIGAPLSLNSQWALRGECILKVRRTRGTCEWNSSVWCVEHETSSFFARIEYQRARWQPPFMPPRWLNIFTCSITQAPSACPADCSPRAAASRICAGCFCDCCSAKFLLFDRPTLSHQRWRGTCWRFGKLSVSTHVKCVCLFKLLEPHVHALKRTL